MTFDFEASRRLFTNLLTPRDGPFRYLITCPRGESFEWETERRHDLPNPLHCPICNEFVSTVYPAPHVIQQDRPPDPPIDVDWSDFEISPPDWAYETYLSALPHEWAQEDRDDALETLAHVCEQINRLVPGCAEWTDAIANAYHVFAKAHALK